MTEHTIHLTLRLRGGMFHPTSGRADNDALSMDSARPPVTLRVLTADDEAGQPAAEVTVDALSTVEHVRDVLARGPAGAAEEEGDEDEDDGLLSEELRLAKDRVAELEAELGRRLKVPRK